MYPKGCGYCGNKRHVDRFHCPAKGKVCKVCGKLNHFAKVCRSNCEKTVHAISQEGSDQLEECDELFIDSVTQRKQSSDMEQAFVNIKIGPKQHEIKFKLDTGSSANVIPLYEYTKLDMQCTLQQTSLPLYGYGGERLVLKGKCNLKCKHKDIEMVMTFYVVDTNAPPVLGLKGCIDFGLIKMVLSVTETQTEVPVLEDLEPSYTRYRRDNTTLSCSKTLQCGGIKTILQRRVGTKFLHSDMTVTVLTTGRNKEHEDEE